MKNTIRIPFIFLLGSPLCASAKAFDQMTDLKTSFERLPNVRAEYLETIHDKLHLHKSEGGEQVYGADGSQNKIIASVGGGTAKVTYLLHDSKGKAIAPEQHAWKDNRSWYVSDEGHTGSIGGTPSGFINPLVIGYFVENSPAWSLQTKYKVTENSDGFTFEDGSWTLSATVGSGTQPRISRQFSPDKDKNPANRSEITVDSETQFLGASFPKRVSVKLYRNNNVAYEKTYELVKIEKGNTSDLKIAFAEKGLVKDLDSGIVYVVRRGQLVPDERFSKEVAEGISTRRILFLGALGILGLAVAYVFIQIRGRAKLGSS